MWYILLFVMWFSPYVFINVSTFNQCDIYFCLSCGFHPMCLLFVNPMSGLSTNVIYTSVCHVVFTLCVYKCQDFQPMWYILLFVMWFSPYVFINVRTFNQCNIYFCLSCGFHPVFIMSGLSTNVIYTSVCHVVFILCVYKCPGLSTNVIYTSVCHVVFTLCVYKCQDFQPMWYILLFVMWFSMCL